MDTDELTTERIAKNQSTFRRANDHIESRAEEIGIEGEAIPLICECADPKCTEIVHLGAHAYEEIRNDPRRFFNAPGHEAISVDAGAGVVVEERPGYVIVEKIGTAGEIAADEYGRLAG